MRAEPCPRSPSPRTSPLPDPHRRRGLVAWTCPPSGWTCPPERTDRAGRTNVGAPLVLLVSRMPPWCGGIVCALC